MTAGPLGKTILVVEDDDITRAGFGVILREQGYAVELAANGREALDCLRRHPPAPDLILLDMLMREMDGWHFLKERDAEWASIPVIIMTNLPIASNEWAVSLGASSGWLRKPIDRNDLLEVVGKCLAAGP